MLRKILLTVIIVCAILALPSIFNFFVMPISTLLRSASALEKKTAHLVDIATTFDQQRVLQQLASTGINEKFFRFDQNLDMAALDLESFPAFTTGGLGGGFTFDDGDMSGLTITGAEYTVKDGTCLITTSSDALITNVHDLAIARSRLSKVEIRLKAQQGKRLLLGLSSNPEAQWSERDTEVKEVQVGTFTNWLTDICVIPLDIVADNTFHTYTIDLETTLARAWVNFDDMIRKLFISLPEIPGNEIEIEHIRFLTKKDTFSRIPFGSAYVSKGKEYRSVLYMNTPGVLRFSMAVPPDSPHVSFGNGVLMPDDPVDFMVCVEVEGQRTTLFRQKFEDPDIWTFHKLDLAAHAGTTVDLIFSASSSQGNIAFWSSPVLYTTPRERFNVVIVLEDALRADHLSLYGYPDRETSPFRSRFAEDGVVFEYAFSQATATRPSCPSLMTSLYPTAAGAGLNHESLQENYLTLAEIMRSQGYATASICQNNNAGYYNGLHQGFSRLYDVTGPNDARSTADVYEDHLPSWLDDVQERNFFLYLHVMAPHGPYDAPAPFDAWYHEAPLSSQTLDRDPALDQAWVENPTLEGRRRLYDGSILHNDHWFERFHTMLASRGLLENTMIVFMSDHGEHLGERGRWGHRPPAYIQGLRVPLFMVYPEKLPAGKRITTPVQLLDVMPTILELAGIATDKLPLQGDSLVSLIDGSLPDFWRYRIAFSEEVLNRQHKFDSRLFGSLFIGSWHILNSKEFLPTRLHNRHSRIEPFYTKAFDMHRDPSESSPIRSFYVDPLSKLLVGRIMLHFHRSNHRIWQAMSEPNHSAIRIDPVVQDRLRDLGYLQ